MSDLESVKARWLAAIADAGTEAALEEVRVSALGKKGEISLKMRDLGKMSPEQRKQAGPALNALKDAIHAEIGRKKEALEDAALNERLAAEWMDVTLNPRPMQPPQGAGTVHPVSQVMAEITAIFADLGFSFEEGPHIESDFHNFDALNIPPEHPARQEHDTFYMSPRPDGTRHVLRTHTSPVQVRTLMNKGAPVRFIAPGRVYRSDYDLTHTPMFHQVEGMAIGADINMAHLKWVLEEFLRAYFEVDSVELRFRASHFPFTEPSAEVDVRCSWSGGQLKIGEGDDWMEILGSGMVHPKVLAACGVDPDQWQGFAFGIGVDRLTMLKYGAPDLRALWESDLRWLRHYGFACLDAPSIAAGLSS
ncbi:MAG: phenylalanine--tRNA ligase subunit alpha [Neomegalonema sp.]|nr:phenylalanine--tRNA ligase subunit alpha [Neomegalonema sp.]